MCDHTILVIEDDRDSLEAMCDALQAEGYRTIGARDGQTALAHLDSGRKLSAVLLDLMMPTMDGWQFVAEWRKRANRADLPLILVSGEANLAATARELGAVAHLRKPVDLDVLLGTVAKVDRPQARPGPIAEAPTPAVPAATGAQRPSRRARILAVDDEPLSLLALGDMLGDEGFDVETAVTGAEALQKLARIEPDVLLTDINLPDMNGAALCAIVRERVPNVRVVVMTGHAESHELVKAVRQHGRTAYVGKPLDFDVLMRILETTLISP